jgi:hypothetical protein
MSYIILSDYKKSIQTLNLQQITGGDSAILEEWQRAAQAKAVSYLTQKYDTAAEFTDTAEWSNSKVYAPGQRVYLDAPAYVATNNYLEGDLAVFQNNVYIANDATTGAFVPDKWDLKGPQYKMYYGSYPYPFFDINQFYNTGDIVFWKGKTYTAKTTSFSADPIQYTNTTNLPPKNFFPDQLVNNQANSQWGVGTANTIPAGTAFTDPLWTDGDNRSAEMLNCCIDIVLYFVHKRISPMNIPTHIGNSYNMAIQWLMDCATGLVTPALAVKQPNQGHRIRIFGKPKLDNSY